MEEVAGSGTVPCNEVFSNKELRQMILAKIIMNGDNISRQDVSSLRKVNTDWALTTSKIFEEMRKPFFFLELEKKNSWNESAFVKKNGKVLDKLVEAVTRESRLYESVPPISLTIKEEFFRQENYQSLCEFFKFCGGALLEMVLTLPLEQVPFSGAVLIPPFPLLKKLIINFPDDGKLSPCSSTNFSYLLNMILIRSTAMSRLEVTFAEKLPPGFQNTFLPLSLTSLTLSCVLETPHLKMITGNKLPNLTSLDLLIPQTTLQTEALFDALDSIKTTLKSLSIYGMAFSGQRSDVTYLRFPLMGKLEKLEITCLNSELEVGASNLQLLFPKLRELTLTNQTLPMLRRWTEAFTSPTVTTMDLHVVSVSPLQQHLTTQTLDRRGMSALHKAFPNLEFLGISVDPKVTTTGMNYIFEEMTNLSHLTLLVVSGSSGFGADLWDGLFIGVSPSAVRWLNNSPPSWVEFQMTPVFAPSIRNLKNLRSLSLWETRSGGSAAPEGFEPLITDVSFYFSFMRMPNLKILNFKGGFKPSAEKEAMWKKLGRTINYN